MSHSFWTLVSVIRTSYEWIEKWSWVIRLWHWSRDGAPSGEVEGSPPTPRFTTLDYPVDLRQPRLEIDPLNLWLH